MADLSISTGAQDWPTLSGNFESFAPAGSALVAASATLDPAGADNALVYTAVDAGPPGNDITVTYVDSASNNVPLTIDVTGSDIVVNLATDGSSAPTTTADALKTAIAADDDAAALVTVADAASNDGSGVLAAVAETPLTGGAEPVGELSVPANAQAFYVLRGVVQNLINSGIVGPKSDDFDVVITLDADELSLDITRT